MEDKPIGHGDDDSDTATRSGCALRRRNARKDPVSPQAEHLERQSSVPVASGGGDASSSNRDAQSEIDLGDDERSHRQGTTLPLLRRVMCWLPSVRTVAILTATGLITLLAAQIAKQGTTIAHQAAEFHRQGQELADWKGKHAEAVSSMREQELYSFVRRQMDNVTCQSKLNERDEKHRREMGKMQDEMTRAHLEKMKEEKNRLTQEITTKMAVQCPSRVDNETQSLRRDLDAIRDVQKKTESKLARKFQRELDNQGVFSCVWNAVGLKSRRSTGLLRISRDDDDY